MTGMAPVVAGPPPRERLVAAAEEQFRRFGYRRTTIDDITRRAGTGKGSLYLHFDSKESVYLAVIEASLERFVARATAALHAEGTVPRRLAALTQVTAEHYGHDELLRASLLGDSNLVDGRPAALAADIQRSRIRALLTEILQEGRRDGTLRADIDPETSAAVLFEMGWGVVRAGIEEASGVPLETALTTLNHIVGRGIRAARP
ncbi:HTH-type transcriptional repressor KstR2 [Mycobacterium pseudokansasii]|nr:HTH-type transcriptional repressor KstR2 [Mycobacterium pseudokansasii]VAZ89666.1 HTH-type transcriptional repressor KstR2 [Mycobacterium pseudokansasii]